MGHADQVNQPSRQRSSTTVQPLYQPEVPIQCDIGPCSTEAGKLLRLLNRNVVDLRTPGTASSPSICHSSIVYVGSAGRSAGWIGWKEVCLHDIRLLKLLKACTIEASLGIVE